MRRTKRSYWKASKELNFEKPKEHMKTCTPWVLFGGIHFFEDSVHDEGCKEEGAEVGDGLGDLDSQKTEDGCQDQQCRDQEESLAAGGNQCGTDAVADRLGHHISHNNHTL